MGRTRIHAATAAAARVPLHKSPIFIILSSLVVVLMLLSVILHARLQDDDISNNSGDDLVLGSGGGDGLRRETLLQEKRTSNHRDLHQATKDKADDYDDNKNDNNKDDDDEPKTEIVEFQKDQEAKKRLRLTQGALSVRETYEQERFEPDNWNRTRASVNKLRLPEPISAAVEKKDLGYSLHGCPNTPPPNYPVSWNVMTVLAHWNPDETEIPRSIHQGICMFDWNNPTDREKAEEYRRKEVPFVIQNLPEVWRAAERWTTPGYLEELIGDEQVLNEHSENNHFMYWKTRSPRNDYVPPTDQVRLTFKEWFQRAQALQNEEQKMVGKQAQTKEEHWYFRLNAMLHNHAYLYEELPFFDPTLGKSLTMVKVNEHRGINCRFGMKGVIAEAHYDSHNNFIALMGGQRRYILAHPNQCENLELYPISHPSARHSRIDWSNAYYKWGDSGRPFAQAMVNEVVLQAGDVLYLPTFWFHFIVSLKLNYQCNSRSGESKLYEDHISRCGFGPRREYDKK